MVTVRRLWLDERLNQAPAEPHKDNLQVWVSVNVQQQRFEAVWQWLTIEGLLYKMFLYDLSRIIRLKSDSERNSLESEELTMLKSMR